jgi:hypothetical protein
MPESNPADPTTPPQKLTRPATVGRIDPILDLLRGGCRSGV